MNLDVNMYGMIPVAVLAGALGTVAMTLFMRMITKLGITNADMVVALGSIITRQRESAFQVGLTVHFILGALFGVLYFFGIFSVFSFLGDMSKAAIIPLAVAISGTHGAAVACAIVWISEDHPLQEFRKANFAVGIAHLLGHFIYGIVVGFVAYIAV